MTKVQSLHEYKQAIYLKQILAYYSETGAEVCIGFINWKKEGTERWTVPKAIFPGDTFPSLTCNVPYEIPYTYGRQLGQNKTPVGTSMQRETSADSAASQYKQKN